MVTISGGNDPDTILGTGDADDLDGLGGSDSIFAFAEVPAAFTRLAAGPLGKVIVAVDGT